MKTHQMDSLQEIYAMASVFIFLFHGSAIFQKE